GLLRFVRLVGDDGYDVLAVRRQPRRADRLLALELERLERMFLPLLGLVFLPLLGAALDDVEQLALLFLHILLALRALLRIPQRVLIVGAGQVGELLDRAAGEIDRVHIISTNKR